MAWWEARLTKAEREHALSIADFQAQTAKARKFKPGNNAPGGKIGHDRQIAGAMGEVAFAKIMGLPFPPIDRLGMKQPDFEPMIDVKTTASGNRLLLFKGHPAEWKYALMFENKTADTFLFWGWAYGHEVFAKARQEEQEPGRPAFYLDERHLRPREELLDMIIAHHCRF